MILAAHQQTAVRIDMQGRAYLGKPLSNSFLMKTHYSVKGPEASREGLILLPEGVFDELRNKMNSAFGYWSVSRDARTIRRLFFSGFLQPHDSHCRVAIPRVMLAYAGLERDVYITPWHSYLMLTREPLDGNEVKGTTLDAIIRIAESRALQTEQQPKQLAHTSG